MSRRARTIHRTLWTGLGAVGALLVVAAGLSWASSRQQVNETERALARLQREVTLTLHFGAGIAQELLAAERYLNTREAEARSTMDGLGFEARRTYRALDRLSATTPEDARLVAGMMANLATAEAHYAAAHRLADMGRANEARARADRALPAARAAVGDLERLGSVQRRAVAATSARVRHDAERRNLILMSLLAGALLLAAAVAHFTVRSVVGPLAALVGHARRLSEGDLSARSATERMPGEFGLLGTAMNGAAESLATMARAADHTAEEITRGAGTLAGGAEQVSSAAYEIAQSVSQITTDAERQMIHLAEVDGTLGEVRLATGEVLAGIAAVAERAVAIERTADARREGIGRALRTLDDVRGAVHDAAGEMAALDTAAADILRVVGLVSALARQSNLLALNAAIEAARAGDAGRGFGIVADEVRKLAEQTAAAADEIGRTTRAVTEGASAASRAMARGSERVGEIASVSREIEGALAEITGAARETRDATEQVAAAARGNTAAVADAAREVAVAAQAAADHAAAAQEVSATTEEQTASCHEISSTAARLLESSTQLREAMAWLRVGDSVPVEPALAHRVHA